MLRAQGCVKEKGLVEQQTGETGGGSHPAETPVSSDGRVGGTEVHSDNVNNYFVSLANDYDEGFGIWGLCDEHSNKFSFVCVCVISSLYFGYFYTFLSFIIFSDCYTKILKMLSHIPLKCFKYLEQNLELQIIM